MLRRSAAGTAILATFLLAACSQALWLEEAPAPAAGPAEADGRVVVEFWHTYSDLESEVFENEIIPLFEAEHPGIAIRSVRHDYTEQLKDNVMAAVVDGKPPDVMRMDIIWVPDFASRGMLTDVSGLAHFDALRGEFAGQLMRTNYYRGRYYGIPLNANTKAAVYNLNLLRRAGLDAPPATFAELAEAARRLKDQDTLPGT